MVHPDLALVLANQHHADLIAEADRYRRLAAARRSRTAVKSQRGLQAKVRGVRSTTLPWWRERVAVPPR